MFKSTRKGKMVKVAAAAAAIGSIAAIGFVGNSPASADPAQWKEAIRGFGSDTTQDILNAWQGQGTDGSFYTPLETSGPGQQGSVLVSWDAFENIAQQGSECITPQVGGPQVIRPNGSGNGHRMISASANPAISWPIIPTTTCDGNKAVQGMADFARSSSGPGSNFANSTGPLAWIPFGRDSLTFAYSRPSGSPVTSLSTTVVNNAHAPGALTNLQIVGGVPIIACGIQTGSGTYASWMSNVGLSVGGDTGTGLCNSIAGVGDGAGRIQENNGPELAAKAALLSTISHPDCDGVAGGSAVACTNAQLIIGFSASQFIARQNGVGVPAPALGVNGGLGATNGNYRINIVEDPDGIPGIGANPPIGLTGDEKLAANSAGFIVAPYSRLVYNIVPVSSFTGFTQKPEIVQMFVGPTSLICADTGTIQDFGYLATTDCGSTATRGNFRSNNAGPPDLR